MNGLDGARAADSKKTGLERSTPGRFRPSGRDLLAIGAAAFALRLVVALVSLWRFEMTAPDFAFLRDGDSYIRVAVAVTGDESVVKPFDWRVFPGYPGLIAAAHALGARADIAALLLNWLCAAAAAVLSALLFRDRRVGWAMAVLTPSYLMYSTLAMSEPTLMAFIIAGLVLAVAGRPLLGGLLLGYAGIIRPVACFAALGCIVWWAVQRKHKRAVVFAVAALAVVLAGVVGLALWRGSALEGLRLYAADERAYGGEPLTWPFKSLIFTPLSGKTTLWKVLYIYAHVAVVLTGCVVAALPRLRRRESGSAGSLHPAMTVPWLWANTLFCLCIGAHWGFHEFHRFIVPALPPLFVAFRRWLPDKVIYWTALAIVSVALAVWGVSH
ncbi:MAG: hypothetical protein ACYTAN_05875 [Planctomycetota bacterium]